MVRVICYVARATPTRVSQPKVHTDGWAEYYAAGMGLVGKPCPVISGLTFIKGESVQVPTIGQPMVIEFWASWCGPCRMAFPHLTQMARRYQKNRLIVIGLNIEGDALSAQRTVAQQGDKMGYVVAIDSAQAGSNQLMSAAGMSGIPCAFIVDHKGIIRHHGHPMEPAFSEILDAICKETPSVNQPREAMIGQTKTILSRDELSQKSIKELVAILKAKQVPYHDLNEKRELIERILERCYKV